MMWRNELKTAIRSVDRLRSYIPLMRGEERQLRKIIELHPMLITRYYLSLIDWSNPNDPIRRMVVPGAGELDRSGSYDPSDESSNTKLPGLQHKYGPTVLLLVTNRCASYCRYCFRKRLVGLPNEEVQERLRDAVRYIRSDKGISNVLVSGGDPLVLPTRMIEKFLEELTTIPHVRFIRFGTRIPVVFPDRILEDDKLIDLMRRFSRRDKRLYIVSQFNHPREITDKSKAAVARFIDAGMILSNQTVLLKGVNDDSGVLTELFAGLTGIGVVPYYLFQCRPVKRVKKMFQVPLVRGCRIMSEAKRNLSGISKRFRYVMSHRAGKVQILGISDGRIYFSYHEAKHAERTGKLFSRRLDPDAAWLDDLPQG